MNIFEKFLKFGKEKLKYLMTFQKVHEFFHDLRQNIRIIKKFAIARWFLVGAAEAC